MSADHKCWSWVLISLPVSWVDFYHFVPIVDRPGLDSLTVHSKHMLISMALVLQVNIVFLSPGLHRLCFWHTEWFFIFHSHYNWLEFAEISASTSWQGVYLHPGQAWVAFQECELTNDIDQRILTGLSVIAAVVRTCCLLQRDCLSRLHSLSCFALLM